MQSCEELYASVASLIETGDHAKAIKELESLLDEYPDFANGHYDLGSLYLTSGDRQQALERYQRAVELDPQNTTFLKTLADYYYTEENDIAKAKPQYHRVIEKNPQHVETLQILGNLAVVERDLNTAKEFYQKVLDIEPWNHDALMIIEKIDQHQNQQAHGISEDSEYEKIHRQVQEGKVDDAIHSLEQLIKERPDFAIAYNDLGVLYYQAGMKEKTLECYEEAVRLDPNQMNFQKNLAEFYFVELGRVEDALKIYHRLLNMDPTDIETLMATGYICRSLNRNEDAVVFFERILDIEPWNLEASDNLDQLSLMTDDNI